MVKAVGCDSIIRRFKSGHSPYKNYFQIPILRKIKGANMVLCCNNAAFIESTDKLFIELFQEYYHSFKLVDDLLEIPKTTPVFKIAVYHFDSSEEFIYPVIKHLKEEVLLKILLNYKIFIFSR